MCYQTLDVFPWSTACRTWQKLLTPTASCSWIIHPVHLALSLMFVGSHWSRITNYRYVCGMCVCELMHMKNPNLFLLRFCCACFLASKLSWLQLCHSLSSLRDHSFCFHDQHWDGFTGSWYDLVKFWRTWAKDSQSVLRFLHSSCVACVPLWSARRATATRPTLWRPWLAHHVSIYQNYYINELIVSLFSYVFIINVDNVVLLSCFCHWSAHFALSKYLYNYFQIRLNLPQGHRCLI